MKGNLTHIWAYAWRTRKLILRAVLFGLILLTIMIHPWTNDSFVGWWGWLEPLTGTLTLAVAALVWFEELNREWEESLPKKLTASFYFDNCLILQCEKAYLASVSDIRAWAQQLGRQMADGANLEFEPFIQQLPGQIDETAKEFKLYEAKYTLTELPKAYKEKYLQVVGEAITENNFRAKANRGQLGYIRWSYDPVKGLQKEWKIVQRP